MLRIVYVSLIGLFVMLSCKPDVVATIDVDLSGKWMFVKAYRNKKETKTLSSGYFDFDTQDSIVQSNIFQNGDSHNFDVESNSIIVADEELNLEIEYLESDTMILKGKIWKFDMEFHLQRDSESQIDSIEAQ